jgi:hypothetical protein
MLAKRSIKAMEKSTEQALVPVAPDAVRVWRGFRRTELSYEEFYPQLGSFFIPGTVQIQAKVGLAAYLPSVLPPDKPAAAPDEIAVVFYEYQDAYHEAKETVGGRAYSALHGVAFDLARSTSGFPIRFTGELEPDMKYHLFDQHVDWQRGIVNTFVGVRDVGEAQGFLSGITGWLSAVQQLAADGPDGAIVVAASDSVVYWEHWPDEAGAERTLLPRLAELTQPVYQQAIAPYPLYEGLWDPYPGVSVRGGESFNFQFKRRKETA